MVRGVDSYNIAQTAASTLLRQAISKSAPQQQAGVNENTNINANNGTRNVPTTTTYKETLPASFLLCVQVEELLDVSQNAETRLKYGPMDTINPTPVGNQRNRCLKLLFSDGYMHSHQSQNRSSNDNNYDDERGAMSGPMIAVEVSPIRDLSTHSQAGIKILLRGPIDVRLGVLHLHEGNVIVLGGCVEELVEVQKRAHEQAKRVAGIGVDATVRALVNSSDDAVTDLEGAEDDEHGTYVRVCCSIYRINDLMCVCV